MGITSSKMPKREPVLRRALVPPGGKRAKHSLEERTLFDRAHQELAANEARKAVPMTKRAGPRNGYGAARDVGN